MLTLMFWIGQALIWIGLGFIVLGTRITVWAKEDDG